MNNEVPIPRDIGATLKSLAEMTAMLTALKEQAEKRAATVSLVVPQMPLAQFMSTSADLSRALKAQAEAIQNFCDRKPMNQQMLNVLNMMRADAERHSQNIERVLMDIAKELDGFDNIQPRPPGDDDLPGDEWKRAEP